MLEVSKYSFQNLHLVEHHSHVAAYVHKGDKKSKYEKVRMHKRYSNWMQVKINHKIYWHGQREGKLLCETLT